MNWIINPAAKIIREGKTTRVEERKISEVEKVVVPIEKAAVPEGAEAAVQIVQIAGAKAAITSAKPTEAVHTVRISKTKKTILTQAHHVRLPQDLLMMMTLTDFNSNFL